MLANDLDVNLGLSGIQLSAVLVSGPTNGQLTLNADGSFSYTSAVGFIGADTFRYSVYDGYVDSVNIADVSIQVSGSGFHDLRDSCFGYCERPGLYQRIPVSLVQRIEWGIWFWCVDHESGEQLVQRRFLHRLIHQQWRHPSLGIDVNGKSWGLYANTNVSQGTAVAFRSFTEGSLVVGQSFNISMDNGWVNSGGGAMGWILRTGNDTNNKNNGERFEFSYLGGGIGAYQIFTNPAAPPINTSLGYTDNGITLSFTLTSADTFSLAIVGTTRPFPTRSRAHWEARLDPASIASRCTTSLPDKVQITISISTA